MTRLHVTISLLCLSGSVACTDAQGANTDALPRPYPDASPSTAITSPLLEAPSAPPGTKIDLYGNPVEHAVGEYRIDPYGEPYELHAPDTELPVLGPAGT